MFAAGIVLNFSRLYSILFSGSLGIFKEYIFPKFLLPDLWILKGLLGCLPFKKEAKRAEMASHRNSIWLSTQNTSLPS